MYLFDGVLGSVTRTSAVRPAGAGERLSPLDSLLLYVEDAADVPVLGAALLRVAGRPGYDDVLSHVEGRLGGLPRFGQRIADVPFEGARPVWVEDARFDLRHHVRHIGLPEGGGETALKALVARLLAERLERSRPLWDLILVDGHADDRCALVLRLHHALSDGVAGVSILQSLFGDVVSPGAAGTAGAPVGAPSSVDLLAGALLERASEALQLPGVLWRSARAPRRLAARVRGVGELARALGTRAGGSPLNVPVGSLRRFEFVDADLDECRRAAARLGGTVNDLVLTVVAAALGRLFRARGLAPADLELTALVPVSMRSEAEPAAPGNRFAGVFAPLPIAIDDPHEQFAAVHTAMRRLKRGHQSSGGDLLVALGGLAPPIVLRATAHLLLRHRAFNLIVSNVRGPQGPLAIAGHAVEGLTPVLPLLANQTLGVAVMSSDGMIGFGLLGDGEAMADLGLLAEALGESITTLVAPRRSPRVRRTRRSCVLHSAGPER